MAEGMYVHFSVLSGRIVAVWGNSTYADAPETPEHWLSTTRDEYIRMVTCEIARAEIPDGAEM